VILTESSAACWNCGRPPDSVHFCRHCQSLQPPAVDRFAYLGLEQKLRIDRADLENRFYELSRRLHPDRYFQRPERERQLSLDATAVLNDAYRTLKDPVARAEYLLGLHGIKKGEQKSLNVPPELLEEVFELNVTLEEMRSGAAARPQLETARVKFERMLHEVDQALEGCFARWDQDGGLQALESIHGALNRRNYIRNLLRDVTAALS